VEVAEKHAFFGQKWLKNMHFSGGSGWKWPTNTNGEHPLWPFFYYNRALDLSTRKVGTSSTTWQGENHHNNSRRQDIHSQ
jgi:hypothetical protein